MHGDVEVEVRSDGDDRLNQSLHLVAGCEHVVEFGTELSTLALVSIAAHGEQVSPFTAGSIPLGRCGGA